MLVPSGRVVCQMERARILPLDRRMSPGYRPRLMRRRPSAMTTLRSHATTGGMSYEVELDTKPEKVPGTLLVPDMDCPPIALMLHGAGSDRGRMSESIGRALLTNG